MIIENAEFILGMTDEETKEYVYGCALGSPEFIRRWNLVYFDYGLRRAGILNKEPIRSGELIMDSSI